MSPSPELPEITLADGTHLWLRPLVAGDREALAQGFAELSADSRYLRFHGPKPSLSASELTRLTELDHVRDDAVVAVEASGELVAVARYASYAGGTELADVAVTVADAWQGRGVGSRLTAHLVQRARRHGIARLSGTTLAINDRARRMIEGVGFQLTERQGPVLEFALELGECPG